MVFNQLIPEIMIHINAFEMRNAGFALLKFQARVESDPHGALANWNPVDENPCNWSGIICVEDRVQVL